MNEIVAFAIPNPVQVLTDPKSYSEFYQSIRAQLAEFVPDTSTERGRKEIASMAYKVTRSKTAIDDAGKKLNEEARAKINAVDAQRRKIREELEALAAEVRQPLTDWEEAEDARKEAAANDLRKIADMSVVSVEDTAASIKARWDVLNQMILREDVHLDGIEHARASMEAALDKLEEARARAQQSEDDQRELARLREEAEKRAAAEREEQERKAREEAEAKRKADAEAEQKRRELLAAEKAKLEAAQEAARIQKEQEERIARIEAEKQAQAIEFERKERARLAEIERTKREEETRQADRAHRSKIMGESKNAIMTCGADEETAKKIVLAIIASEIPHVSLRF